VAPIKLPRVVIAGLAGDSGKTLVSLGLVRALRSKKLNVAPFKKGPDFIDAAWLGAAAEMAGRNLDTYLMPEDAVLESLAQLGEFCDVAVVEGNRGLFDGLDADGTHSTANLAKLIDAPVVLVVDCTKSTRTVAAQVMGCQAMDPDLEIAGVILNRVGTSRQESVIREAVTDACGLRVFGAIPRIKGEILPSRHLGLVTAMEHPRAQEALERVAASIRQHVDVSAILNVARHAPDLVAGVGADEPPELQQTVRIGVLQDAAFSFYYPENLEALMKRGAQLVKISPLNDSDLPEVDALYAGGGFPEVYAAALSANREFCDQLAERVAEGLPVWAECGGLMYLARALSTPAATYPMVGALPIVVEQFEKPQGHGYVQVRVDQENPFFGVGTELRGHEFHYSRLEAMDQKLKTVFKAQRGEGLGGGRDGILVGSVLAGYTHLHALGTPGWADSLVSLAAGRKELRASQRAYREPAIRSGEWERKGKLRREVERLVVNGEVDELDALVSENPRAIRYLLGLSYRPDEKIRKVAARGIALAGKYHPGLVQNVVRRLVWAMNEESGANALTAPVVLQAIAEEQPELLLPMVPDIIRLAADNALYDGLARTLHLVKEGCPGKLGKSLSDALNKQIRRGEPHGVGSAL
jgi:cobyrinic acid a,c-diamide synthase